MPIIKPRELKSLNTIDMEPQRMTPKIMTIIYLDLAGKGTGDIAREMEMTESRISVIKGSPMYRHRRDEEAQVLRDKFMDKQTDKLAHDPVKKIFQDAAEDAAKQQVKLMQDAGSEFARLSASDKVLEHAGYVTKADQQVPAIKVEAKIVNRFEQVLTHANKQPSDDAPASVKRY